MCRNAIFRPNRPRGWGRAGQTRYGRAGRLQRAVSQFTQTQVICQSDRQQQSSIGHQAMVVEGNADAVGLLRW